MVRIDAKGSKSWSKENTFSTPRKSMAATCVRGFVILTLCQLAKLFILVSQQTEWWVGKIRFPYKATSASPG
jgi:hypothetical protein